MPVLFHFAWSTQTNPSTPEVMSKQKEYIGSGKAANHNSVTVTLALDKAMQHAYSTTNGKYITFMVSPKQEVDRYGKTHTAFVFVEAPQAADSVVAEPQAELPLNGETPMGKRVKTEGRNLKRISPEEAAKRKAKK